MKDYGAGRDCFNVCAFILTGGLCSLLTMYHVRDIIAVFLLKDRQRFLFIEILFFY